MNCCFIIILLLLLGNCNCGSGRNNGCNNSCNDDYANSRRNSCDDDCDNSRRNSCDDNCDNNYATNRSSDSYGNNRYSMYNMNNDDCDCHN